MSKAEIEDSYKISRRIEGEERGLDYATMVFTSTQQEVTTAEQQAGTSLPPSSTVSCVKRKEGKLPELPDGLLAALLPAVGCSCWRSLLAVVCAACGKLIHMPAARNGNWRPLLAAAAALSVAAVFEQGCCSHNCSCSGSSNEHSEP